MAQFEVRRLALVTLPSSHLRLVIYVPFARFDVCSASITTSRWYQPNLQLITPTTIKKRKFISEIRSMKLLPACTLRLCKSDFNLIFRLIVMKRVWKYENIWKAFRERVCDCLPFLWLVKIRSFLVTLSPAIVCWQKREERKKVLHENKFGIYWLWVVHSHRRSISLSRRRVAFHQNKIYIMCQVRKKEKGEIEIHWNNIEKCSHIKGTESAQSYDEKLLISFHSFHIFIFFSALWE